LTIDNLTPRRNTIKHGSKADVTDTQAERVSEPQHLVNPLTPERGPDRHIPRRYRGGQTTEPAEDRCWNCGIVPKRWFDVTPPGLDEQRFLCSNCFARTTRPRIEYGWPGSPSPEWDEDDGDEKRV
jgi:hypothetical protein